MLTSSLVKVSDLINAADDLDRDIETMHILGYPVIRNPNLPNLLRKVAVELEVLQAECWRLSQNNPKLSS
jgi:hypothetical protein